MRSFDRLAGNAVFALQTLLVFLLLFEQQLQLPALVQTLGRTHPLLLHLPIGFLVFLAVLPFLRREIPSKAYGKVMSMGLSLTSLTAVLTALFGLFLAQEGGYGESLNWHKWTGVVLSWMTYGLFLLHQSYPQQHRWFTGGLAASLVLVIVTGHLGATLTHGEGFLLAPLKPEKEVVITEATSVYAAAIAPILDEKCAACHNERKSKGELVMTSLEKLLAGGENGPVWVAGNAEESHLIQRVNLPREHEEHMPPEGKPQLEAQEIELLHEWIQTGADTARTIGELGQEEQLYALVKPIVEARMAANEPQYDFEPASPDLIQSLNNPFRSVRPAAINLPALQASIYVRQSYKSEYLEELTRVKDQLVYLNLSNLPIRDEDLNIIAQFPELEELILTGTDISGENLATLQANQKLHTLSVSNTEAGNALTELLPALKLLEKLYIWNTQLTEAELEQLQQDFPRLKIYTGYQPDPEEMLPLSPPLLKNKEKVIAQGEKVELKQSFPGAVVRYTTDGSEPDSLTAPVYEGPFKIEGYSVIKAKTYRDGWLSSPTAFFTLFQAGIPIDSVFLGKEPNPSYTGDGPPSLIDNRKGDAGNFRAGAWLGYKDTPFEAYFYLEQAGAKVSSIVVSYCQNMGAYIMPPTAIKVWGGEHPGDLQLLKQVRPEPPSGYGPNQVGAIEISLSPSSYSCYKVVAEQVTKLPSWHNGAGDKGWIFVDEVFFY